MTWMRAMFIAYTLFIATGLALAMIIGLLHQ